MTKRRDKVVSDVTKNKNGVYAKKGIMLKEPRGAIFKFNDCFWLTEKIIIIILDDLMLFSYMEVWFILGRY